MYDTLASEESLQNTIASLKQNGMDSIIVETGEEAKKKALELVPKGVEIFTMTSMTLEALGLPKEFNGSDNYDSVRNKLNQMDRQTEGRQMQKLGAAPEWTIGSVHAVTENGQAVIASNTGSQLPAYAYGASHVVWIVGTQKIVSDLDTAMKRIYDYVLPLESKRAHEAYGMVRSNVSKLLIINKEVEPGRITIIFVKEKLGF